MPYLTREAARHGTAHGVVAGWLFAEGWLCLIGPGGRDAS